MDFLVYLICLGVGLVFTLATALLSHLFGGHEGHLDGSGGHAEAGADASDMPGMSAFSPMILSCFVTAFGGLGIIFHQFAWSREVWVSAPLAMLGAFLIASAVLSLMRKLFMATQSSSESRVCELAGTPATIITPIPVNGVGEIAYVSGGSRYTAPAREARGQAVEAGRPVVITAVIGSQYYVSSDNV